MYDVTNLPGDREHTARFTADPDIIYVGGGRNRTAYRSFDGGVTWTGIGNSFSLFADYHNPLRIIKSTWDDLLISYDGGTSWTEVFYASDPNLGLHVAGAHFDQDTIVVATNNGLLVSTNGGTSFAVDSTIGGIPSGQSYGSFASAKAGGVTRFFCVAARDIYGGITAEELYNHNWINDDTTGTSSPGGVYRLDWGTDSAWTRVDVGQIDANHSRAYVRMASNNIATAYVAAHNYTGFPDIYKTSDGGGTWSSILSPKESNKNIETGWGGRRSRFEWWWGGRPVDLGVDPLNADRVAFTDYFWVHLSLDGGTNWRQAYTSPSNPANVNTPRDGWYTGVGLENTSSWWVTWKSPSQMFASYTDMTGIRSDNGGERWSYTFSYAGQINSTYQVLLHSSGAS